MSWSDTQSRDDVERGSRDSKRTLTRGLRVPPQLTT
jgi:hypothetical protein